MFSREASSEKLYGQQLHLGPEQRRVKRFTLVDQHLWSIKVNDRAVPIEFVQDLNWQGARIRVRDVSVVRGKKQINLKVFFRGQQLFSALGNVRWVSDASVHLGLLSVGIEFQDPQKQIEDVWRTSGVENLVREDRSQPPACKPAAGALIGSAYGVMNQLQQNGRLLFLTAVLSFLYYYAHL